MLPRFIHRQPCGADAVILISELRASVLVRSVFQRWDSDPGCMSAGPVPLPCADRAAHVWYSAAGFFLWSILGIFALTFGKFRRQRDWLSSLKNKWFFFFFPFICHLFCLNHLQSAHHQRLRWGFQVAALSCLEARIWNSLTCTRRGGIQLTVLTCKKMQGCGGFHYCLCIVNN